MIIIIIFPLKSLILLFLTNDSCSFFVLKGLALICSNSLRIQETHFVMGLAGFFFLNLLLSRMFHIDDVPSGAGEGIKDINKALAVCVLMLTV